MLKAEELVELARLIGVFAGLPAPANGNDVLLSAWIADARTAGLPHLHDLARGINLDRSEVDAAFTLPFHNGRTEGINTRTKRIMRQIHGRASFELLRHELPP